MLKRAYKGDFMDNSSSSCQHKHFCIICTCMFAQAKGTSFDFLALMDDCIFCTSMMLRAVVVCFVMGVICIDQ